MSVNEARVFKHTNVFMKSLFASFIAGLALIAAIAALIASLSDRNLQPVSAEKHYEVAPAMGDMQRFVEKLYFAGQARNWELANFYLHEIEETADEIIRANVFDEGVAVSAFLKTMLPPAIEATEEAIKAQDSRQFASRYEGLITSCNACHQSTKHGFVKITVPRQPTYQNQNFATD
jgi:cytochrome c553